MFWLWLSLIVVSCVILVLVSKVKVAGSYKFPAEQHNVVLECRTLYGLIRLRFHISLLQDTGDQQQEEQTFRDGFTDTIQQWQQWGGRMSKDRDILFKVLQRVTFDHLRWHTEIGTSEAPTTAIVTGVIWGIKSTIVGTLTHMAMFTTRPDLQVTPQYNTEHFQTVLGFQMRLTISTLLKALIMKLGRFFKRKRRFPRRELAEKT